MRRWKFSNFKDGVFGEFFHVNDADGNLVATEASSTSSKTVEKNLDELDETGITVVNNAGTELPSTGGIGTTIFYVIGAILVIGAGVVLVTRRRMNAN